MYVPEIIWNTQIIIVYNSKCHSQLKRFETTEMY